MLKHLVLALGVAVCLAPAAAQSAADMAPVHCLSAPEAQRFAKDLEDLMKKEGLGDAEKFGREVQTVMLEALDKRTKADSCAEDVGDAAARRCKAAEAAADQAEKRVEDMSARMEKFEKAVLAVRARYRRC
ncbi:MAG: hypothetical protein HY060_02725 [Proteobacteria bacterium]|nr:hypothetical protein [Pseudomonadota bacterium]